MNDFLELVEVSYNAPKFSACATWNPNAITFADINQLNSSSLGLFIDRNNTLYASSFTLDSILVWTEGSSNITTRLFGTLSYSHSIFATTGGDVYADNGFVNHRLEKWAMNETDSTTIMNINGACGGLFIDINDSLYCSYTAYHQVWKKPVNGDSNSSVIIAGNGTIGAEPNTLSSPFGIFVSTDLSVYVADFGNNRIQLFRSGQINGITMAGKDAPGTIALATPIAVILDADGYIPFSERKGLANRKCLYVRPTNQKAAFLNQRPTPDFGCKGKWG